MDEKQVVEFEFNRIFNTDGKGYWSNVADSVSVLRCEVWFYRNHTDFRDFGELRVYFDPNSWRISERGLIYTDEQFLQELRIELDKLELSSKDVEYSEQGMQGEDYVSLDVGADFIQSLTLMEWFKIGLAGK